MIVNNIKWIMLFVGAFTCTTLFAVIDPQNALINLFGSNLIEPLADLVVQLGLSSFYYWHVTYLWCF